MRDTSRDKPIAKAFQSPQSPILLTRLCLRLKFIRLRSSSAPRIVPVGRIPLRFKLRFQAKRGGHRGSKLPQHLSTPLELIASGAATVLLVLPTAPPATCRLTRKTSTGRLRGARCDSDLDLRSRCLYAHAYTHTCMHACKDTYIRTYMYFFVMLCLSIH